MKNIFILLIVCLGTAAFLFGYGISYGQVREDEIRKPGTEKMAYIGLPNEITSSCEKFFNGLIEDKIEKSFKELLQNSPIVSKDEQLQKLIDETKRANKIYGNILGFEPVNSERITNNYIRLRFLGYHTDFPMRWVITYYKSPSKGWIVINIKFDDLSEYFFKEE